MFDRSCEAHWSILCSLGRNLTSTIPSFVARYVLHSPESIYQAQYYSWIVCSSTEIHVSVNQLGAHDDCGCLSSPFQDFVSNRMWAVCSLEAFETLYTEKPITQYTLHLSIHSSVCRCLESTCVCLSNKLEYVACGHCFGE